MSQSVPREDYSQSIIRNQVERHSQTFTPLGDGQECPSYGGEMVARLDFSHSGLVLSGVRSPLLSGVARCSGPLIRRRFSSQQTGDSPRRFASYASGQTSRPKRLPKSRGSVFTGRSPYADILVEFPPTSRTNQPRPANHVVRP